MLCILPFEPRAYEGTGVPRASSATRSPRGRSRRRRRPTATELGLPAGADHHRARPGEPSERDSAGSSRPCWRRPSGSARATRTRSSSCPVAPTLARATLEPYLAAHAGLDVTLVDGRTEEVVGASDAALVKSGTSTLEAALMLRPMVVVYRLSWLSYLVARAPRADCPLRPGEHPGGSGPRPRAAPGRGEPGADGGGGRAAARRTRRPRGAARPGSARCARRSGEPGAPRRVAEEVDAMGVTR